MNSVNVERTGTRIENGEYWFKVVGFLMQNWAVIERDGDSHVVYFFGDDSGVFDRLEYDSPETAEKELRHNGFKKYDEDGEAKTFLRKPDLPLYEPSRPGRNIYSSGRYWKFLERKNAGSLTAELRIVCIKEMAAESPVDLKGLEELTGITPDYNSVCTFVEYEDGPKAREIETVSLEFPVGDVGSVLNQNESWFTTLLSHDGVWGHLLVNVTGIDDRGAVIAPETRAYVEGLGIRVEIVA